VVQVLGIITFSAEGKRIRDYSSEAIDRLLEMSRVIVKRDRAGRIKSAQFRHLDGGNLNWSHVHRGTSFAYVEHLDSGRRLWQHKRVDEKA
jgi:hypothetical protein